MDICEDIEPDGERLNTASNSASSRARWGGGGWQKEGWANQQLTTDTHWVCCRGWLLLRACGSTQNASEPQEGACGAWRGCCSSAGPGLARLGTGPGPIAALCDVGRCSIAAIGSLSADQLFSTSAAVLEEVLRRPDVREETTGS